MLLGSECIAKALAYNCCIVLFLLLVCHPDSSIFAEARRRGSSKSYRFRNGHQKWRESSVFRHRLSNPNKDDSNHKKIDNFMPQRARPTVDARTERIRQAILTLPELSKLLDPLRHASNINDIFAPADNFHLMGTVRRRRLYCRVGMGYHLEIRRDGRVMGRHRPTRDGILEIFSVKTGVVGIRAVASQRYLCMNKRGKLYSSSQFIHECEFRKESKRIILIRMHQTHTASRETNWVLHVADKKRKI
uniref:fibroblast growth factor 4-like n=1 Tax=Styela clava TaxID=7725 RepID=UPI00193A96A7|nr:fibroblast growth factor 4-like [Styela clava]